VLADAGVEVTGGGDQLTVHAGDPARLRAADITTAPYPGLATDLQSPTAVLLTQAQGTSRINETIFEDRLEWMDELRRMGASVEIPDPHHALVHGPSRLRGAEVEMSDLRAGASLMLAAFAAEGESVIHGAHQVRRGYENIEGKFLELGASIEVISEGPSSVSSVTPPAAPVPAAP
jgi:UDP-N-acetylglucosamine 1-carboxyvinyltransferase